jgi:hypothetical protein
MTGRPVLSAQAILGSLPSIFTVNRDMEVSVDTDAVVGLLGPVFLFFFSFFNYPSLVWELCFGLAEVSIGAIELKKQCTIGNYELSHFMIARGLLPSKPVFFNSSFHPLNVPRCH